jgi:hypothetical protein
VRPRRAWSSWPRPGDRLRSSNRTSSRARRMPDGSVDRAQRSCRSWSAGPWATTPLSGRHPGAGMRCPKARSIGSPEPPSSAAIASTWNDVARSRPTDRCGARTPETTRTPKTSKRRRYGGGRRRFGWRDDDRREEEEGDLPVIDTIQLRRPPRERAGPGSARASGPGPGPWASRSAELKRGEIEDDQRSQ